MLFSFENNVEGSRLDAKTDEELLHEVRYDQIHRQMIDRSIATRARTPEMTAGLGLEAGDSLGTFAIESTECKNYHGRPQHES